MEIADSQKSLEKHTDWQVFIEVSLALWRSSFVFVFCFHFGQPSPL